MSRPRCLKPKYCRHKSSNRAFVRINGRQIWLGRFGSQESRDSYDAHIGQWIGQGRPTLAAAVHDDKYRDITVIELVDAYWEFAKEYYKAQPLRSDGHLASLRGALSLLIRLFGDAPVREFGPLKLIVVRDAMAKPKIVELKRRVVDLRSGVSTTKLVDVEKPGWTRGYLNNQLKRLKRMFACAVSRELIEPNIFRALETVEGLRKGKTSARESRPVQPAKDEDVQKVLPLLPPPVRAMIELMAITGMRPGEVRIMRGSDIEITRGVWIYRPQW